ncbi:CN37 phosphodiesterase, partial [Amia calva]|nr:CN37 phosphodiesterase [Amia calva]
MAEGSLSFPFLEHEDTMAALREAHTLFILRGLPGSGKSLLAQAIGQKYQGLSKIISADDRKIEPAVHSVLPEEYKGMDEETDSCCKAGTPVIVLDDTNHDTERLARLYNLAEQHGYSILIVEPKTPWKTQLEELKLKTHWSLSEAVLTSLKGPLEETPLPLFYGWFLTKKCEDHLRKKKEAFLKNLSSLDGFKECVSQFTTEECSEEEVNLEQYFHDMGVLHCTTKFCDYGKADGAKEYAEKEVVRDALCHASKLKLSALFVTPRTLGARVALTDEQLKLWPADAEKEVMPEQDLPLGSRAHVTLGCAKGVEPVQTGKDLLEFVKLEKEGNEGEKVQDLEQGELRYFGKGMWMLRLSQEDELLGVFSGFYGKKKEADKAEEGAAEKKPEEEKEGGAEKEEKKESQPEGKKKSKCTLL